MLNRVLIVCTGNICRSPIAHKLFEKHLPHLTIKSAGVLVDKHQLSGAQAVENSQLISQAHGLDLSQHRAQQLSPQLIQDHDLILVMTHEHIDQVALVSSGARAKSLLIGQWVGIGEVADPIGQSLDVFEHCYSTLERAVISWKTRL